MVKVIKVVCIHTIQAHLTFGGREEESVKTGKICDKICFTMLSTPDSQRRLHSLSVKLFIQPISPQFDCFAATFTHAFTRTTQPDVLFIVHAEDSAFTTARNRKLHALPPPSTIKMTSSCTPANNYRIAGNFRGVQFSRFSWLIGKPRKLNLRNKVLAGD